MNKSELVSAIAGEAGLTLKQSDAALKAFIKVVKDSMVGGEAVSLIGFGTFEVRERPARKGRNPRTGQEIDIPAAKTPAFKPGKPLKDQVNGN
ncbi:MAG: HU family DNA-binding protein [Succinivibrionaceae bacterium]|nr:HU family DNA-binding protein [Succinivibrionaceae bacterium]